MIGKKHVVDIKDISRAEGTSTIMQTFNQALGKAEYFPISVGDTTFIFNKEGQQFYEKSLFKAILNGYTVQAA